MTTPISLNRYVYSLNNPVNYIDPSGETPFALVQLGWWIGRAILNYSLDVAIGVAIDYLFTIENGKVFDLSASIKANAKESAYTSWSFTKKVKRLSEINDQIKKAKGTSDKN